MKTVLVTGSEGFTGRYVVKALRDRGYHVVGLVRENPGKDEISCDLTDRISVQHVISDIRPDGIIHLAALAFVGEVEQLAFYSDNIFGTLNILEALDSQGTSPDKVIIASSANVYGNPGNVLIDENTPPAPVNHYAASKLAMEFMAKTWFGKIPIIITRPFNYTGPLQSKKFLVPKIVDHFQKRMPEIELGNLDVAREFSDVRDVAIIYLKLLECPDHSSIVNICSGKVYPLNEIIERMNRIAGYSIGVKQNPAFMRTNEIKVLRGSNKKLHSMINFTPRFDLSTTLKDMYHGEESSLHA